MSDDLTVVTWKWHPGSAGYTSLRVPYEAEHVNVLEAMVRRRYAGDVRFICVTDKPAGIDGETFPLWPDASNLRNATDAKLPSCYRRLKLFDPATQAAMGIAPNSRIVSLDLDTVIVDDMTPLWDRPETFVGWALKGSVQPRVFNGSMWMLRAGCHADVWSKFHPLTGPKSAAAAGYRGSDQAWMSMKMQGAAGWTIEDGVCAYTTDVMRTGTPPAGSRIVMFCGRRKPWHDGIRDLPWVRDNYRKAA